MAVSPRTAATGSAPPETLARARYEALGGAATVEQGGENDTEDEGEG